MNINLDCRALVDPAAAYCSYLRSLAFLGPKAFRRPFYLRVGQGGDEETISTKLSVTIAGAGGNPLVRGPTLLLRPGGCILFGGRPRAAHPAAEPDVEFVQEFYSRGPQNPDAVV